ncbi:MAG: hypothetical protein AAGG68_28765 [Bacteroidota bacterium]
MGDQKMLVHSELMQVSNLIQSGDLFRIMEVGKMEAGMKAYCLRSGVLSNDEQYDPMTFYVGASNGRTAVKKFKFGGLLTVGKKLNSWGFDDWWYWITGRPVQRVYEWRAGVLTELQETDLPEAWVFARTTVLAVRACEKVGLVVQSRRIVKPNRKSRKNGRIAS